MARFYFHLCDGADVLLDDEGRELDRHDVAAAALAEARAMISADALTGRIFLGQSIEVRDHLGNIVHRQSFEDAVLVSREPPPGR
jgi:hypothetical protein